jgi:hypothetical protein
MLRWTTQVARAAIAFWVAAVLLVACAKPPHPYVDTAEPDPNDLLARVMQVASSGNTEKIAVLERVLGLRLELLGRDPRRATWSQPLASPGPSYLRRQWHSAHLRTDSRPAAIGWRAFLTLHLDTSAVCMLMATVIARYGDRGEWRTPVVMSGWSPDFYAVLVDRSPYTEVWFRRARADEAARLRACVEEINVAVDCANERCGGLPSQDRNDAVFRPRQASPSRVD